MHVGILEVQLELPGACSLKDKRRLVKGALQRIRQRFEVSAAEVAYQDRWRSAGLGFSVVGNDVPVLQRRLQQVAEFLETQGWGVVVDYRMDFIS
jgi:hypothetical protein